MTTAFPTRRSSDLLFGPAADLLHVPVAGRGFEGYGEDPWLASRMAVHYIRGVQQQGVIADFKHYADYTQEGQVGLPPLTGLLGARVLVNVIVDDRRSEEHTSELQSLMRNSYAVFCLQKK